MTHEETLRRLQLMTSFLFTVLRKRGPFLVEHKDMLIADVNSLSGGCVSWEHNLETGDYFLKADEALSTVNNKVI